MSKTVNNAGVSEVVMQCALFPVPNEPKIADKQDRGEVSPDSFTVNGTKPRDAASVSGDNPQPHQLFARSSAGGRCGHSKICNIQEIHYNIGCAQGKEKVDVAHIAVSVWKRNGKKQCDD